MHPGEPVAGPAFYEIRGPDTPASRPAAPDEHWSTVLGLQAPWLQPERISADCVTRGYGVPDSRKALEVFETQLGERVKERCDAAGGRLPPDVARAQAEAMRLHQEALAVVDAHAALPMEAIWLKPRTVGKDWVCIKDGEQLISQALQDFKHRLDARIEALKASGTAIDSPGFVQARATCERLHEQTTLALEAQRKLGVRAPWLYHNYRDLLCATLEGVADLRQRLAAFIGEVEEAAAKCKRPDGVFESVHLEGAFEACGRAHQEATLVADLHESDIRNARMSEAVKVEEIPPSPPDARALQITIDTRFRVAQPVYVMDDPTAEEWADRTMKDLEENYQPPASALKSSNKANLRRGFNEVADSIERASAFSRARPGSPEEMMAAARNMPFKNCVDLVRTGQGYLRSQKPPISSSIIHLRLPCGLNHEIGVVNAHHLSLGSDITQWPPEVWVFDRWVGKRHVRARDYPQHFLNQMRKWHANEQKFIRADAWRVEGVEGPVYRWLRPLDKRWVEGVINALRNLPEVKPDPSDSLQPWPGTEAGISAGTGSNTDTMPSRVATPETPK